ncbi:MAG TPA: C1 family peptidase [Flavipsychrobacter sp.]|jgi:bleomycin hydrolase|nr:C1 family peptidase [Flavipsychrobacter sp.]
MKKLLMGMMLLLPALTHAQDDLIKKIDANKSDSAKKKFEFTPVINVERTSVKNQASSGTCWSYSTNSFLESEMVRMGKKPVDIAEIYTARCVYSDKADNYVRMHGDASWGDGGACHDVINMYRKYGAMPQEAYTGLHYGTDKNKFGEMQGMLKAMLDVVIKNPNGKLTPSWKKAFNAVMDAYLGKVPKTFEYKGVTYTPQTFADEVVGINPDDYVELSSFTDQPYYQQTMLMVPDNWSYDKVYNVKMKEMTDIIDYALSKGYSVSWATDVTEKYFSWKNGVAFVPEKEWEDMNEKEQKNLFNGPQTERKITANARQEAFDNYTTTDDHGMHIVGIAKDQTGKEYYIVKNSWGDKNDFKGYLYVTKAYVQYKTTAFLLHKKGIPSDIRQKLHLN